MWFPFPNVAYGIPFTCITILPWIAQYISPIVDFFVCLFVYFSTGILQHLLCFLASASFLLLNNIETKTTIVFLINIFRRNGALSKVFIFKSLHGILKYLV